MAKQHGLGKGLSSLIPSKLDRKSSSTFEDLPTEERIVKLPVEKISANTHQPRTDFDHQGMEDLMNSIKTHGVMQPVIVTKTGDDYELIAGERRLRASKMLGLETIPGIIREVADQQKLELALIENIQRRNLTPIEEAMAFQRLIDEFSLTQEEVAKRLGKSRGVVANTLRLLQLPQEVQNAIAAGKISFSVARIIAGLPQSEQVPFYKKVLQNDLTVKAVEQEAKKISVRPHTRKTKDPNLTAQEEELQKSLGTKVSIKKRGEQGTVIIEFYSQEEFEDLLGKLTS